MTEWMKGGRDKLERMNASCHSCWLMFCLCFSGYSYYLSLLRRPPPQTTVFQNLAYFWDAYSDPTIYILNPNQEWALEAFKTYFMNYLFNSMCHTWIFCFMSLCLYSSVRLNYIFMWWVKFHPLTFYEQEVP